jgi:hypothetical protein
MTARYRIEHVADFLSVPESRRRECLNEFAMWLELAPAAMVLVEGIDGVERPVFVWIDDGRNDAKITFQIGESP